MKTYFKNIDFLRFLFATFIVILHTFGNAASNLEGDVKNVTLENVGPMNCCVEFFFIISGFFLMLTFKPSTTMRDFVKTRIIRLSPVMVFTVFIFLIASFWKVTRFWSMDNIFALFFLSGMHVAAHHSPAELGNIHSTWYVSVLFWISLLYFYLLKNWDRKYFNLIVPIIIFIGMYRWAHNLPTVCEFGVNRGLFGIGLGCMLGELYLKYKDKIENLNMSKISRILITFLEVGVFGYLCFGLAFSTKDRLVNTDLVFLFIILMGLFIIKQGLLSKMLENKFSVMLGSISYAIFVTHTFLLDVFNKYWFVPDAGGANLFQGGGKC